MISVNHWDTSANKGKEFNVIKSIKSTLKSPGSSGGVKKIFYVVQVQNMSPSTNSNFVFQRLKSFSKRET